MVDKGEAARVRFILRRFPITLNQSGKVVSIRLKVPSSLRLCTTWWGDAHYWEYSRQ